VGRLAALVASVDQVGALGRGGAGRRSLGPAIRAKGRARRAALSVGIIEVRRWTRVQKVTWPLI
jgi:hypothetical protein